MPDKNPATSTRLPAWLLIALAAFIVRLWGLTNGLPDALNPDETFMIRRALRFGGGDLNPHFFYHPSLAMYVFFLLDGAYYAVGRALGWFGGSQDFILAFVRDPSTVYVLARSVMAVADSATAGALAVLGARLLGPFAGTAAGLLWVVFPPALQLAQVGKPDGLMVFLTVAAALVLFGAPLTRGRFFASGVLLGLAASAKYMPVLLAPFFLGWYFFSRRQREWGWAPALLFPTCVAAGFLLGTPYALLDAPKFLHDFAEQSSMMRVGMTGAAGGAPTHFAYLKLALVPFGSPAVGALAFGGLLLAAREKRKEFYFFAAFIGAFLLSLGANPLFAPPYFLAACPFLFLLTAGGLEALRRRKPALARALLLFAALPYVAQTTGHMQTVSHPDTRTLCRQWVEANVPPGATVLMDASGPPLRMTKEQLENLYQRAKAAGHMKADLFALELKAHTGGGYRVFLTEQALMLTPKDLLAYSRSVQDLLPIDRGVAALRAQGVRYVLLSSAEEGFYRNPARLAEHPAHAKFYDDVRAQGRLLAEFPNDRRPGPALWVYAL